MRKIILIAFTLMVVGGNISASAASLSGNKVLKICKDPDQVPKGICIGYVNGASEGLTMLLSLTSAKKMGRICIPNGVTNGQKKDIFIKYLENNPKDRHMIPFVLFAAAMREAYPCPK